MRTFRSYLGLGLLAVSSLHSPPALAADATASEAAPTTSPSGDALIPPPASEPVAYPACTGTPSEESLVAARGAFDAGNAAFNERSYARALLYWEDAYRRDCTAHAMLKNLARAYELNDQLKHAINAIETYLQLVPDSGEEAVLRDRIADLETRLAERESAAAGPAVARPSGQKQAKPASHRSADSTERETSVASNGPLATQRSAWPLIFAGVGAGVVGLSTIQWIMAKNDEAAAARECPKREGCPSAVTAAGNRAIDEEITWSVVGIGGGAVLVASVVWFLAQEPAPAQALLPNFGTDYAGLRYFGRF
jgi:hypothetical protein